MCSVYVCCSAMLAGPASSCCLVWATTYAYVLTSLNRSGLKSYRVVVACSTWTILTRGMGQLLMAAMVVTGRHTAPTKVAMAGTVVATATEARCAG